MMTTVSKVMFRDDNGNNLATVHAVRDGWHAECATCDDDPTLSWSYSDGDLAEVLAIVADHLRHHAAVSV